MKNKNTTLLGIAALLGAIASVLNALFDGDSTTNIDYGAVATAVFAAFGLIFARDSKPSDPVEIETPSGTVLVEQVSAVKK